MLNLKTIINKKSVCIILLIILVFVTGCNSNNTGTNTNTDKPTNTTDTNNNKYEKVGDAYKSIFGLTYSGETVTYNAYDFIIEKLSQAQYWTYDEYEPLYRIDARYENGVRNYDEAWKPQARHVINNGTGFTLYNEDKAQFVRGFQGRLIIDFSDMKAYSMQSNDKITALQESIFENIEEDLMAPINENSYKFTAYDFINETIIAKDKGSEQMITDDNWQEPSNLGREIKNTIEFYEEIFSCLGVPLMAMPEGTLASYKNVTIEVPFELVNVRYTDRWGDNLIHDTWSDQKGVWQFIWEDEKDLVWLDDYRDIFNQRFPEITDAELLHMTDCTQEGQACYERDYPYYAPIFLVFASEEQDSEWEATHSSMDEPDQMATMNGAYFTYFVKPLYEKIFGFNGVYFTVDEKANGTVSNFWDYDAMMAHNLYDAPGAKSMSYYNYGEGHEKIGFDYVASFKNEIKAITNYMNELCEHYGVENSYGKDYVQNFILIYDMGVQKELGLR